MATDPIARVKALIALAGSTNDNEARTAAVTACRLMREHGLTVTRASRSAAPWDTDTRTRWEPAPEPRPAPLVGVRGVSDHYGRCFVCGEPYERGDPIVRAGEHVAHGDCGREA